MTITKEISLRDFGFWGGAKQWANLLTEEELDTLEYYMDDGEVSWDETMINDFIWFDTEIWLKWLGLTEDKLLKRKDELYE